jgi:hypothetical protein
VSKARATYSLARVLQLLVVLVFASFGATAANADEPIKIDRIEWVSGTAAAFPPANSPWQSHTLPLRWSSGSAGATRQGVWLRLSFAVPEVPTEGWSLLLHRLPTGGTVYLNGKMVAVSGNT